MRWEVNILLGKRDGCNGKMLLIEYGKDRKRSTFLLTNKDNSERRRRGIPSKVTPFDLDPNQPWGHGIVRSAEAKKTHGTEGRPMTKLILLVPYDGKAGQSPEC